MAFSPTTGGLIRIPFVLAVVALLAFPSMTVEAQRRGGGGGGARVNRNVARTNVRSAETVNRNVTRNRDIDRDVDFDRDIDVDRDIDIDVDYDRWGHPIARGVAAGLAIGTTVALLPSGCSTVVVNGIAYSECGSSWYQPYYSGTTVQYVVVNPPQ